MDESQTERVRRFLEDEMTSKAIYSIIMTEFEKKPKSLEVNYLAASRIAIDFLKEAWNELEKFRVKEQKETKIRQVGL